MKKASNIAAIYQTNGVLLSASSVVMNANGQPTKRYKKDLVRVGDYYKASTDQSFKFTAERLEQFASTFSRMKAAGVKVPVPVGHTNDPEANRGYVEDMYVDGDTLYATIELIGEEAIALSGRVEVSIYAVPELVDGKGNTYNNVIEHVALVTNPVIPDQDGFVPIAASHGVVRVASYKLSNGASPMNEIAKALGIETEGMDEAAMKEAIMAKIKGMSETKDMAAEEALKKAQEEVKASRAELEALKLSRSKGETNPQIIKLAAKNRANDLDGLVKAGKITKAVRDQLAATWIGTDNKALALSLDDENDARFDRTIKALGENDAKVMMEQTRSQAIALAREVPGGNVQSEADIDATAKRLAAYVNGDK